MLTSTVKQWFAINDLLLNADKLEVLLVGSPAQQTAVSDVDHITVADAQLLVTPELKSRGVIFDSLDAHVAAVCRACNYYIWTLRHIREVLPVGVAQTLACDIVSLSCITATQYCMESRSHKCTSCSVYGTRYSQSRAATVQAFTREAPSKIISLATCR